MGEPVHSYDEWVMGNGWRGEYVLEEPTWQGLPALPVSCQVRLCTAQDPASKKATTRRGPQPWARTGSQNKPFFFITYPVCGD
jgi:hypothetical protein